MMRRLNKWLVRCLCASLCVFLAGTSVAETIPGLNAALPTPTPEPLVVSQQPPSEIPSALPSADPSVSPSVDPSVSPSVDPSVSPSVDPSVSPSVDPSVSPSVDPSVSPSVDPSVSPSVDPSVSPSVDPSVSPSVVPSVSPSVDPSVSPSVDPSVSPSVDPSVSPSVDPSVSPSVAPSASPSVDPSASPSASPEASETPAPEPGGWDESLCDHTTENCELAPDCAVEGCRHVGVNDAGEVVALCDLGLWLFEAGERSASPFMRAASPRVQLNLTNGENIIYNSGSYTLAGGGENALLYVRAGRAVSLWLSGVSMLTLNLNDGCVATLGFSGRNTVHTLAASGANVSISGTGSLSVSNLNVGGLTVTGGSVRLPNNAASQNGRLPYTFPASNATSATLEGNAWTELCADDSGNVCVWLPAPQDGLSYTATLAGTTLNVTALAPAPAPSQDFDVSGAASFVPSANTAYTLSASDSASQAAALNVNVEGVSLRMENIGSDASAPSVNGQSPVALRVSGINYLSSLMGTANASGTGLLYIGALGAGAFTASGALSVVCETLDASALSGWQSVSLIQDAVAGMTALYEGTALPLVYAAGSLRTAYVPLPAPAANTRYEGVADGSVVTVTAVPVQSSNLLTDGSPATLTSGEYRLNVKSSGTISMNAGENATLTLSGASGAGALTVGENANLHLVLDGVSALGAISLGHNATLTVSGTGALRAASITGGSVSIGENVNFGLDMGATLPGTSLVPTVIFVTGPNGAGLPGESLQLKLGVAAPFAVTTDGRGAVTLWRASALDGASVVALHGSDTYAAVAMGGMASPDALPTISDVKATDRGVITFAASGANTLGVSYIIGSADLDGTWVSGAGIAYMQNGECAVPGLKPGDVLTYRPFAAAQAGVTLTEATADAFAFGPQGRVTIADKRVKLVIEDQSKTYDRQPFALHSSLYPAGATVAYYAGNTLLSSAPASVGEYTAIVTVPEGDATYKAGDYRVSMAIRPIVVLICPDENGKQKDEADPPLTFTYDETVMLDGDVISGRLTREPGESYGNYAYLLDQLVAPEGYELQLDPEAPAFFIDWNIHHYLPYDPFATIDPVYDELLFSDGTVLSAQIRTDELIRVGEEYYGRIVTDIQDDDPRPVTAALRLRGGYDSALLILTAEAEFARDGGYETDADGNRVYRGRRLTLSYANMAKMREQRIDYVAFGLNGVSVLIRLEDLQFGEELAAFMEESGVSRVGTTFEIDLEPANALNEGEEAGAYALRMGEKLMRVRVGLRNNRERLDISHTLTDAVLLFDASHLLEASEPARAQAQTETVAGRVVESGESEQALLEAAAIAGARGEAATTPQLTQIAQTLLSEHIALTGATLARYGAQAELLETVAVTPYTDTEARYAPYTALMRTSPYLMAPFTLSGLYGLTEPGV